MLRLVSSSRIKLTFPSSQPRATRGPRLDSSAPAHPRGVFSSATVRLQRRLDSVNDFALYLNALALLVGAFVLTRSQRRTHTSLRRILMNQDELAQALRDLKAQNEKAAAEQAAALQKLKDALDAAGSTTPEVDAALADLAASIQAEDDLNPDTPADGATAKRSAKK